jgi:hypothetical protein
VRIFIFTVPLFQFPPAADVQTAPGFICRFSFFYRQANAKSFSNIIDLQKQ